MRLELGRRADYAIRAATDLARHAEQGTRRKAQAIAEEMAIPTSYAPQILAELVRAGLAASFAGRHGGYVLARDPEDITLLQVLHAVDGDVVSTSCVLRAGPCRVDDVCAVHMSWSRAQYALLDSLAEVSLGDLTQIDSAIAAGTYRVSDDVGPSRRYVEPDK